MGDPEAWTLVHQVWGDLEESEFASSVKVAMQSSLNFQGLPLGTGEDGR